MSSESRPLKRLRTEDAPKTRSETWISDGNVVLQAGNMQFRVHWGVLAWNSSVFSDMQGLPQPPDQPTVDGCPVVELPDNATDVEYLLKALYVPTFLSRKVLPVPAVGALIRLGHKYDFKDLADLAVARLTSEYPTTLEEYDALTGTLQTITSYHGVYFDLVALARENNIVLALPCLYWSVVKTTSLDDLFSTIEKADGTVASLLPIDLRRCVMGQQRLLLKQFLPGYTLEWAREWKFHDECRLPSKCSASREALVRKALERAEVRALTVPSRLNKDKFCPACMRRIEECITAGRKKIWEELPQLFDLPPWDELRNDI
ncbi:hypothetical protein K438DRAFT_1953648 [Mycena galopus ATCC 62051]|nr:hypothetical protein K438DRAFT_1953648 [Mycena galopus ATCC 62051]